MGKAAKLEQEAARRVAHVEDCGITDGRRGGLTRGNADRQLREAAGLREQAAAIRAGKGGK